MTKMEAELKKISADLDFLKKKVTEIGKHIVDFDTVLTDDDLASLDEAEKDLREGRSKRL